MTDPIAPSRPSATVSTILPVFFEHPGGASPFDAGETLFTLDADIASTTVSRPTIVSWADIPAEADLRLLDERAYHVGRTRVSLRLWRVAADGRNVQRYAVADPTTGHSDGHVHYLLELSGGGCRRKVLLGGDREGAVAICDRLCRARLSPLHLDDVLADGDLFEL